jgi:uronate dehydrogenase
MRVLVTGAAGSVGTVVCSGLVDRGHDVVGMDRRARPEGFTGGWFTADCADPGALLDAMVRHGVNRIVYASSNHAVGRTERCDLLGTDVRPRPDTFYGLGKVAAEALLRLYVDRYGLDAVATRIGGFLLQPESRRHTRGRGGGGVRRRTVRHRRLPPSRARRSARLTFGA